MRIGDLSRETGVSPRLLRYYEEQGLLVSERLPSGHRRYGADAPQVVGRIRALLAAGLPTAMIRDVLPCVEGEGPMVASCVVGLLQGQLLGLEERIAGLQRTHDSLSTLLELSGTGA